MLAEQRARAILEQIAQHQTVSVTDLCQTTGASEATIRRDLNALARQGRLVKIHGGATSLEEEEFLAREPDLATKQRYAREKERIARYAASLVGDDDVVYLDTGTTVLHMASHLKDSKALFVTSSIDFAGMLSAFECRVYVLGGALKPGTVDIGVRVEVRNEVMETVNRVLYESKLVGWPRPFKNKVRTFCQNPGGFVSQENYDNDLAVVNGHSYKELKSDNTNLAILCSHNFSHPFNQPIAYAKKVGELTNMLGDGKILVQRYGDILGGKRTWQKELSQSNVRPTLPDAVAGDITAAMPYRAMINIINFIQSVDHVVPGFAANETLLYSPELKFYSNRIKMTPDFTTNIKGLYCLGDSSGWTRGLMMASMMGVLMGRRLSGE